ncbi:MAG TPA: NAD(P)-binding domain-containing protein [Balneolaceae bacterium]|nr:NAD(P)-binding domain-containing protein [Balneolaceae bacterium]
MKIGIIGSGNIGGNLGIHLAKAGHQVLFSSRHPEQLHDLAKEAGDNATTGTIREAADFGNVIILSVPFWAVEEVAGKIGPQEGKLIIETVNPYPQRDGEMAQKVRDSNRAASEFVAEHFPEAHVFKAFNAIYFKDLRDQPFRKPARRAVPYAGDHQPSKQIVEQLIDDIGFAPVYIGKLSESHIIDPEQELYTKDKTADEVKQILEER